MKTSKYPELQNIKGIGPRRSAHIASTLDVSGQSIEDFFRMPLSEIKTRFKLPRNVIDAIARYVDTLEQPKPSTNTGIKTLIKESSDFPEHLKQILGNSTPDALYVWGNLELLKKVAVGFCGSRNVTDKGLEVTADIAQQIVELGWVVVSGHARGVDTTAHRVALESGGSTIIVAAEGLAQFKLRQELKRIAKPEQLLIISEFLPDAPWTSWRAMTRNKTIIGLSKAMVLVEARMEGGTFDAGKTALRLKTPLFVAEYQTPGESATGNSYFLLRGAIALRKSRETGRANISSLRDMVLQKQSESSTIMPEQLPLI